MAQRKVIDRTGERHGRLTVLWRAENKVEPSGAIRATWRCICDCGNGVTVTGHALAKGHTKSCGCLNKVKPIKHGKARSRIYRSWVTMIQRCTNPNNPVYERYGRRGITVCERWRSFENFYADMGDAPEGKTLDRIDNEGPYSPENCRWATPTEQQNNTRRNTLLTFQGRTMTLAEWGRATGFGKHVMLNRLTRGWTVEAILTTPVAKRSSRKRKGTDK
jgi:hypothetical protein